MRILFSVASLLLLTSCTYLQGIAELKKETLKETPLSVTCPIFPYDDSVLPCNLVGWQQFAYQALNASEAEHKAALLFLTYTEDDWYKQLILESSVYETDDVRQQAIEAMFKISDENINSFGHFFYLLATYNHTNLLNEKNVARAEMKLKIEIKKNAKLKKQLSDAQAKIQAIMDIEQDLNTN